MGWFSNLAKTSLVLFLLYIILALVLVSIIIYLVVNVILLVFKAIFSIGKSNQTLPQRIPVKNKQSAKKNQ